MANIPIYSEKEIKERGNRHKDVDFSMVFNMPFIERTIFQYAIRDECLKEIIKYENKKEISVNGRIHPRESLSEAQDILACFARNIKMEPICNFPFNQARECIFRSQFKLRWCKNELDLFEECYHDPVNYAKFEEVSTKTQSTPNDYFVNIRKRDYLH